MQFITIEVLLLQSDGVVVNLRGFAAVILGWGAVAIVVVHRLGEGVVCDLVSLGCLENSLLIGDGDNLASILGDEVGSGVDLSAICAHVTGDGWLLWVTAEGGVLWLNGEGASALGNGQFVQHISAINGDSHVSWGTEELVSIDDLEGCLRLRIRNGEGELEVSGITDLQSTVLSVGRIRLLRIRLHGLLHVVIGTIAALSLEISLTKSHGAQLGVGLFPADNGRWNQSWSNGHIAGLIAGISLDEVVAISQVGEGYLVRGSISERDRGTKVLGVCKTRCDTGDLCLISALQCQEGGFWGAAGSNGDAFSIQCSLEVCSQFSRNWA